MELEKQIQADLVSAMKAKEAVRLASLRAIKAAILLAKTAEGASGELTDQDIVKLIQKLVKQRKESAEQYNAAGRPELADNELRLLQWRYIFRSSFPRRNWRQNLQKSSLKSALQSPQTWARSWALPPSVLQAWPTDVPFQQLSRNCLPRFNEYRKVSFSKKNNYGV